MRLIPKKMKEEMLADPAYHSCMRNDVFNDHTCRGRITLEHSFIHAGRQVNEIWAIISICAWSHDVDEWQDAGNLDKEKNQYIALTRATENDLNKYEKHDWKQKRKYLTQKFGLLEKPKKFDLF